MSGKNKQTKKENIFYLILSASLFFISCICSFHVTASVAGTLSELNRESYATTTEIEITTEKNLWAIERFTELPEPTILESQESLESNKLKLDEYEKEIFISEMTTAEEETQSTAELNDMNILGEDTEIILHDEESTEITKSVETESIQIYDGKDADDREWRHKLSESEVELVAIVAMLEDSGAMEAISEVILNRVESDKFYGNTVRDVIYAKNQFYATKRINKNTTASEEATEAVLSIFRDGLSVVGCAEFFAEKSVNSKKIANGLYLIACISDTNFYGQK